MILNFKWGFCKRICQFTKFCLKMIRLIVIPQNQKSSGLVGKSTPVLPPDISSILYSYIFTGGSSPYFTRWGNWKG